MERIVRNLITFIFLCLLSFNFSYAQQIPTTCQVLAVPFIVHSEGLAERMGDIDMQCSGTPGMAITANLSVSLQVPITNRIDANGYATDANISINMGSGPVPSGVPGLITNQSISFNGVKFSFPASGKVTLIIDDVRGNVNSLGLQQNAPIIAYLGGTLAISPDPVTVATAELGLLATTMDSGVTCTGSPSPGSNTMTGLIAAHTTEQTTRVTEGFASSFQPKDPTSDTGTRFLLTYANFPAGAAIYIPDAVAGRGAAVPTSGGDLGTAATVGQYKPGSGTLLLVRVLNADATGTGGTLATLPAPNSAGVLVLDAANPVPLTSGAGYAVYEVVDANLSAIESAQIPNYFAIPQHAAPSVANGSVSLAPVSTVGIATATDPIPRFAAVQPPSDCSALGDCNASYYPQLNVVLPGTPLQGTAVAGGKRAGVGNILIQNTRGGVLDWSLTPTYTNGTNWLFFTENFGIDNAEVQIVADPASLSAGIYQATVTINAGPVAGSQTIPVVLTVTTPPTPPSLSINAVTDAADFHTGPVVAGELASIFGANLAGKTVTVAMNSMPANLLYSGAQQINLRIPPALAGQTSAQLVVTADGVSSAPFTVSLASVAPAIFTPGILNLDYSVNSAAQPAAAGSILQIFGTGMPDSGGVVTVTIQNHANLVPLYAGAAPGLPGMQQVDVTVPSDLKGSTANLTVCVAGTGNQQYCSQPESIFLK